MLFHTQGISPFVYTDRPSCSASKLFHSRPSITLSYILTAYGEADYLKSWECFKDKLRGAIENHQPGRVDVNSYRNREWVGRAFLELWTDADQAFSMYSLPSSLAFLDWVDKRVSANDVCELWRIFSQEWYKILKEVPHQACYGWMANQEIFDRPNHNYKIALGAVLSFVFFEELEKDPNHFPERYTTFLKKSTTNDFPGLLKMLGWSNDYGALWERAAKAFSNQLFKLEQLCKEADTEKSPNPKL